MQFIGGIGLRIEIMSVCWRRWRKAFKRKLLGFFMSKPSLAWKTNFLDGSSLQAQTSFPTRPAAKPKHYYDKKATTTREFWQGTKEYDEKYHTNFWTTDEDANVEPNFLLKNKQPEGRTWLCPVCKHHIFCSKLACDVCNSPNPGAERVQVTFTGETKRDHRRRMKGI